MDYEKERANFGLDTPEFYNFGFDVIDRRAREADKTAFISVDRSGESIVHHRFSDLNRDSNRFANALRDMGVRKGDHAFVMIPRIPAWYHVMIGCIKAGVVSMPGTNLLMPKDIEYRINMAGAKVAIVTDGHVGKIEDIRSKCPSLEHLIVIGGEHDGWIGFESACASAPETLDRNDLEPTRSEDTMLVYFTSGTTSMPKMVPRAHEYALAHTITGKYWMDLREEDIHWTLSDTGWAKAAWGMLFPQWQIGVANVLYDADPRFDADAHLRLVEKLKVSTFCVPPTIYRLLVQENLDAYDLSSIRHSLAAGEPLNPEVMRIWKDKVGNEVHDGYGQTESVCLVANYPGMEIKPGSMGKPVPGIDISIVDDLGNVVAVNEIGNIAVRITDPHPPGLFHGYQKDEDATAKCIHHGWYFTGDMATRDADGYFWFVGRNDDVISSSSYRISPFEVESTLLEHPAVMESAVVGKPDELRGEIVKAYITLASGHAPSEDLKKDIQSFVKTHTAPYKYPREIEFRESLPKTISGKIRRVDLRNEAIKEATCTAPS
ncbi:MAG: AMP-binding protein [Alphaproteobacteria bacterium]|jgi:acyl-coenzyme A synthetase/AMP-(fatty) acid ligase|nr:AMP-binding protein [Alphaproteobacteria bacterium]